MSAKPDVTVDRVDTFTFVVPTDQPESDGTLEWDSTTVVVVEVHAGGHRGLGYTYGASAAASLIRDKLASLVEGADAVAVRSRWRDMVREVRNLGRPGIAATAISALDIALWDLKAHVFGVALSTLLDRVHDRVPIYGSGGFTSYSIERLTDQLAGWAEAGIPRVKMKVGREPDRDLERVLAVRKAVGSGVDVMVDANGAYSRRQALAFAEEYAELGVSWFEEPVSSDDVGGLRWLRHCAPGGIRIAAGEYGYDPWYFGRLLGSEAVDVAQADVTRCCGITGFLEVAGLCHAAHVPLSPHTAPQVSAHAASAVIPLEPLEYFHDHVRIESLLFDGVLEPTDGALIPDPARPGMGLEVRWPGAEQYQSTP